MNALKLADNIARLRRERKLTQEELADFLGVTKASVSKWENHQSTPDILLLPQLASFFDVTVDELLGYEAQMSKEQIRKCYLELSGDFVKLPFEEAMKKIHTLQHRYYACYPFLLEICILYLNHFMLAEKEEERRQVLREAETLCDRILNCCSDVAVCEDAMALRAMLNLQLGKTAEVMEALESISLPGRLSEQNDSLLIQAYMQAGEIEKAKNHTQVRIYLSLLNLIETQIYFLALYENDLKRCEESIRRGRGIIELYDLEHLHPNSAAQFYFQAAIVFIKNGEKKKTLEMLDSFSRCVIRLLDGNKTLLHGDAYFDRLDVWIENLPLGDQAPRDLTLARKSALQSLEHPLFSELKQETAFQHIYCRISGEKTENGGKTLC